ncbi:MAG: lipoyl(octanoyl) transferase LipB [Candidatus Marinimicrobia bacterium]|jgi:lipoate-protein ligase B|nr:lipoyl(octanoyl) transferase LipB [Candidatus Neomarinimicrobiota bacterium]MBT3676734.1 lipoyl(octanoyl) transferase LipB [Candidatus Neomarinimicrobiota bacterium]MBT3764163.1 lipoyl(octanoyl) transferase LipB [Candidatus Neomarinimicrobiota bacterium]MBT4068527.1 lipoyl(octanoyl) transferase LipB [Candidatus Neomarinimicrobiota bacterium]MBT4271430.1 lipoyl(octanoyl) transferase LipB [Candidatus Neomarinimicrobiota bacterium]
MKNQIKVIDLGQMDYQSSWDFQKEYHQKVLIGQAPDTLIFVEHEPVYTLGKNADENHLLQSAPKDAKVFNVERGGDITFHGPGQIVGYPILDLHRFKKNVSWYMRTLEQMMIDTLFTYGIEAGLKEGLTGVWVGDEKIGAQGVRISRWVTMHGFALNVNTDLNYYGGIIPCGIFEYGVTSMEKVLGGKQDLSLVKNKITQSFNDVFHMQEIVEVN